MPMAFPYALICIASVSPHSRASQVHAPEIPQASGVKWAWRGCGLGVGVCPGRVYLSGRYSGKSGARLRWSSDVSPTEQQKACCMQDTETPTTKPQGRGKSSNSNLSSDICLLYVVLRMQTCCSGVCRTYTPPDLGAPPQGHK